MAGPRGRLRTESERFSDVAAPRYERRRPETTVLYEVVQNHLESFLAQARERHGKPLPRYVESEFRSYLRCGILCHGFLRAQCKSCGEELVVAFSCKKRGLCPSCNARRMCNTAAYLADRVFPAVPVRQWVLSTPFELRFLLARHVGAFNRLMRLFADEVMRHYRATAVEVGLEHTVAAGVSFPQRFGSALQLNTHIHAVFCDGVFTTALNTEFHRVPPPDPQALGHICLRVHERFRRWLLKKGLLREESDAHDNRSEELNAIEACTRGSLGLGVLGNVADTAASTDEPEAPRVAKRARGKYLGEAEGFGIHAGVTAAAGNAHGREVLLRYCARPPLALGRLSKLPDGRIAYRLKKPWRPDQTHVVLTPVEFLARVAALIPPPRSPLIRFHGAFAAHARKRARVVVANTSLPASRSKCRPTELERAQSTDQSNPGRTPPAPSPSPTPSGTQPLTSSKVAHPTEPRTSPSSNVTRIDWATLLQRVYDVDALACPCGGRLEFLELVTVQHQAASILRRLGLEHTPPPIRSRSATPELDEIEGVDTGWQPSAWDP